MQRCPTCKRISTKRHDRDQTSLCTAPGLIANHFKTVKRNRDASASVLPDACKCCRPFSESEQAQRSMITPVKGGEIAGRDLKFLSLCTPFAERVCSAGLQHRSDSLPSTSQPSPCEDLTSKSERDTSGKEARGLKLALLVELQQLVRFRSQSA